MLGIYGSRLSLPGAFAWLIITLSLAGLIPTVGTFCSFRGMLELSFGVVFAWFLILSILLLCRVRWSCALMSLSFHLLLLALMALSVRWFHYRDEGSQGWLIWIVQCLLSLSLPLLAIRVLHSHTMAEHFNPPLRSFAWLVWLILAMAIVGIIAYFGVTYRRVIPLLWAKASPKVDYLSQYNDASRPANYDPNSNAATYYHEFFDAFMPLPAVLEGQQKAWPTDLTETEQRILADWSPRNQEALKILDKALAQPYFWIELSSLTNFKGIDPANHEKPRRCTWAMMLWAKHHAQNGDVGRGIELALKLHQVGIHYNSLPTNVEQSIGIAQCQMAYETLCQIMDRCELTAKQYQHIRDGITENVEQIQSPRISTLDEFVRKEGLQRFFTDEGNGHGRLLPKVLYEYKIRNPEYLSGMTFWQAMNVCRTHPGRQETEQQYQRCQEGIEALATKTPWQLSQEGTTYFEELSRIVEGNYLLQTITNRTDEVIELSYGVRALGRATATIAAIHQFKLQKGRLPESLKEILKAGNLSTLPADPYSDGPLVYRKTDRGFTLYSVGSDLADDGGPSGDFGYTLNDTVFWPFQEIDPSELYEME